jgi:adenylate kinase family enzyme
MEKEENELLIRIKSFMDNGELVPNYLLEELLKSLFKESLNQDILLTEFPKTIEQFLMLKKILNDLNLEIQTIWYIKQKNAEEYMDMHFKNPNEKLWLDKYGDEVIEKWKQEFEKKQIFITEMQNITDSKMWKVVEMDCETELDEELLIKKINDCA